MSGRQARHRARTSPQENAPPAARNAGPIKSVLDQDGSPAKAVPHAVEPARRIRPVARRELPPCATRRMIQELNAFSKSLRDVTRPGASRPVFYEVKDTIEHRLRRELKPTLDPGEYIVADAVLDRSLGWGDLAKCMSVQDFVDGVIDDDKSFKLDQDGIPIFAGVGFERRHTGDLLKQLRTKGIIERLPVANSGRAYLWFPAPRHQLACLIRDLTGRPGDLPELLTRGL